MQSGNLSSSPKRVKTVEKRNDGIGCWGQRQMKKSVLLLVLLLVIQLCGCSLVPVGTRTSDIETLKNWSFQHNEGTNDYSVFFALLTGSERYVSADVDVDIRIWKTSTEMKRTFRMRSLQAVICNIA